MQEFLKIQKLFKKKGTINKAKKKKKPRQMDMYNT